MVIAILFWSVMLLSCAYAAAFGGRTGKWGAILFVVAVLATIVALWPRQTWVETNIPLLIVDGAYFIALYVLAVRSHRYWPIWSAGFQLLAVLTHIATLIDPAAPRLYRALESFWALPMLVTMVIGIVLDRHAGLDGEGTLRTRSE